MLNMSRAWVDLVVKNSLLKASLKFGAAASLSHEGHTITLFFSYLSFFCKMVIVGRALILPINTYDCLHSVNSMNLKTIINQF